MKLINKDALVAEIDRQKIGYNVDGEHSVEYDITRKIIDIINALEVKEVDLEKAFNDEYSKFSNDVDAMDYSFPIDLADYKDFAKHFFKLGLKADNKWADGTMIDKACEWIEQYLFDLGYPDDWCRDSPNIESGKERFIKAMKGE